VIASPLSPGPVFSRDDIGPVGPCRTLAVLAARAAIPWCDNQYARSAWNITTSHPAGAQHYWHFRPLGWPDGVWDSSATRAVHARPATSGGVINADSSLSPRGWHCWPGFLVRDGRGQLAVIPNAAAVRHLHLASHLRVRLGECLR